MCYKTKSKHAFYNCMVLILRIFYENVYKEVNVKIFNTGRLSFPGMLHDKLLIKVLNILTDIFKSVNCNISYKENTIETVMINSNFNCGFYINRDVLYNILQFKYELNVGYDPCAYPGIQCKYTQKNYSLSFMIFRTGSVLIVGKCNEEQLYEAYEYIKNILLEERSKIYSKSQIIDKKKTKKKKCKKKTILISAK